jgi:hypothetical protein
MRVSKQHKERAELYHIVFQSDFGRQVLEDLNKLYNIQDCFDGNPYTMAYKEGQRSVILRIQRYMKLAKEHILEDLDTDQDALEDIT